MADPIVVTPPNVVSNFSPAPNRRTDTREQFTIKADQRMTEENRLTGELNQLAGWMNDTATLVANAGGVVAEDLQEVKDAAEQVDTDRRAAQAAALAAGEQAGAAQTSAQAADEAAQGAGTFRNQAETFRNQAQTLRNESEEFRDQAQVLRDQTEEIKIGDAIDDTSLRPDQARSAQNDSIGNFRNVPMAASGAIVPLDFAQITAAGASITVTLPVAPLEGTLVMVGNLTARRDHQIAVGAAKVKGQDAAGFILIDKPHFTITLKYVNAAYGWEVMQ